MKSFPYRKSIIIDLVFRRFYLVVLRHWTWKIVTNQYPKTKVICWLCFEVGYHA